MSNATSFFEGSADSASQYLSGIHVFSHVAGREAAHLVLRVTLRIMIFWRRSYMWPDAIVNTCTRGSSRSASVRACNQYQVHILS